MFHADNKAVRELLLTGFFGLEKESLRITPEGFLAQTPTPFPVQDHIVRDFSENQVEINTSISSTPEGVVAELEHYSKIVQETLANLPEPELLWPFSNPPFIRNEEDVPVAQYTGEEAVKTEYRDYLSDRYGRYKMAFSGIHFNYSFSEELLRADFELSDFDDYEAYRNEVYLALAERLVAYGWIMTAITAASPVMDTSFVERGMIGGDLYQGLGTVRCSELGYWNFFAPILDYSSVDAYAASIERYQNMGFIRYPSELYYPIRIKPRGAYGFDSMRENGISHIELRMFDLNPLSRAGIDVHDVKFGQLLLTWLASTPRQPFCEKDQVQAIQNFKNAAHYDLNTVKIVVPNGEVYSVVQAALNIIGFMEEFYEGFGDDVQECLQYQKAKFTDRRNSYAVRVRERYGTHFVVNGIELAKQRQQEYLNFQDTFQE